MKYSTKGIVLNRIKYGDNSLVVNIFTENFGKTGFMIHVSKSKKNHSGNYLQPMYILDMQVYIKPNRDLQNIKEIHPAIPVKSIAFDFRKTALCQFMAELISKTQRENESDETLFNFLANIIEFLDETDKSIANFAPFFIIKYSRFLGLQFENNYSPAHSIFDMRAGKFIIGQPLHQNFAPPKITKLIHQITEKPFTEMHSLKIDRESRNQIINLFINYFNFHLNKPGKINSLPILTEVFEI